MFVYNFQLGGVHRKRAFESLDEAIETACADQSEEC